MSACSENRKSNPASDAMGKGSYLNRITGDLVVRAFHIYTYAELKFKQMSCFLVYKFVDKFDNIDNHKEAVLPTAAFKKWFKLS